MSAKYHVKTESDRRYDSRTGEPRDDFSVWINEGDEHLAIVSKRVVRSDGAGTRLETREEVEARAYAIVGQLNAQYLLADLFEALTPPPKAGCDCDMDGDRPLPCVFHRFEHQMRAAIARAEKPDTGVLTPEQQDRLMEAIDITLRSRRS